MYQKVSGSSIIPIYPEESLEATNTLPETHPQVTLTDLEGKFLYSLVDDQYNTRILITY